MGILFIILIIVLVELIQILNSRFKIRKWILPILSLLLSINIILGILVFEKHDSPNNKIDTSTLIYNFLYFAIFNIPTLIFIITNYIVNKKQIVDKQFYKNVKICILITLIITIILFVFIQISISRQKVSNVSMQDLTTGIKDEFN